MGLMPQAWYWCCLAMQCKAHGVQGCPGLEFDFGGDFGFECSAAAAAQSDHVSSDATHTLLYILASLTFTHF
jgi:hypothetical protein